MLYEGPPHFGEINGGVEHIKRAQIPMFDHVFGNSNSMLTFYAYSTGLSFRPVRYLTPT